MREHALRDAARWRALDAQAQRACAEALGVPAGVTLESLERGVAVYARRHERYALVPGGWATLGEDAASVAAQMSEAQRASYAYSQQMFRNLPALIAYLESILLPQRRVYVEPFLMEITASPLPDWEEQRAQDEPAGFALPSVDQWEYACRAGAKTLWRWGSEVPLDAYPTQSSGFGAHLEPNAFGLRMTLSPWSFEVCRDERLVLGGNGGTTIFEGAGYLLAWLPLASAFFEIRNASGDTSFACARKICAVSL